MEEVTSQPSVAPAPSELPESRKVDHTPPVPSSSSHENCHQGNNQSQKRIAGRFIEAMDAKARVDTAAPIDSVKGAVSKFGGMLDSRERRTQLQEELDKVQVEVSKYQKRSQDAEARKSRALQELKSTASVADELRLNLEKAQAEEAQARQETELADVGLREEAELIALKTELESSHAAHGEAEEKRARLVAEFEQDKSQWQSELEEAEAEAKKLRDVLMAACDLEMKNEAASELLASLVVKMKLFDCTIISQETGMGEEEKQRSDKKAMLERTNKELEDVKQSIDKAKHEAECLRFAADSMRAVLDRQKAELAALQRNEGLSASSIPSLEEELNRATSELAAAEARAKEQVHDESNTIQQIEDARREADQANDKARSAREEASIAKAAVEARLEAVAREILAANASEEMATSSATALITATTMQQEEESNDDDDDIGKPSSTKTTPTMMILTAEEYEELSRRAVETEEAAGKRVLDAVKLIKEAKDAQARSIEKLAKAARQTEQRRQALQAATEEAEEAEFAKLSAERELRQWRADHQLGLAEISVLDYPGGGNPHILSPRAGYMPRTDVMLAAEADARQRKTTFLPRMVMFLARKKAQTWK